MDILSINLGAKKALEKLGVKTEKVQTTVFQGSPTPDGSSNYTIDFIPVADKEYTVVVNGETSTQKATAYTVEELGSVILLGNQVDAGGDANGVEWNILYVADFGISMFAWLDGREADGTTISITQETETIHPIDPKFLPKGCAGRYTPGKVLYTADISEANGMRYVEADKSIKLVAGKTYVVEMDSGRYEAVCKTDTSSSYTMFMLGNTNLVNGVYDGKEPFFVCSVNWFGQPQVWVVDANKGKKVVVREADTVDKIDPRYIPAAEVLDFDALGVSLQTMFATGGGTMSASFDEMFDKVVRGRSYVVRAAFMETTMDVAPIYMQWGGDILYGIGFTVTGYMDGNLATGNFFVDRSNVYCTVSMAEIP